MSSREIPTGLCGVPAHRDRHVEDRCVGSLRVTRRNPRFDVCCALGASVDAAAPTCRNPPLHQRARRQRLDTSGDEGAFHAGDDLRGGVSDRGQAARAVTVDGLSRNVFQPSSDRCVPSEVATAVVGFGQDDVVDVCGIEAGSANHLREDGGCQFLRRRVDQRTFEGTCDRGADRTDDYGLWHG